MALSPPFTLTISPSAYVLVADARTVCAITGIIEAGTTELTPSMDASKIEYVCVVLFFISHSPFFHA